LLQHPRNLSTKGQGYVTSTKTSRKEQGRRDANNTCNNYKPVYPCTLRKNGHSLIPQQ